MGSVYDYLQYLMNLVSSEVSLRKVLGIVALISCLILFRSMWRQGVKEFKKGMLSHDEPQRRSDERHFLKQPAVKTEWEPQFVRFCRASGLAIRRTAKELRAGKRSHEHSTTHICPKCGRTYEGGWAKFCAEDGTKLVKWNA